LLIPRFSTFLEHYPDISLDLIFTNRVVDLAREGVDLALRAGRLTDPQLVARTLLVSDMKLAAAPGHPLLAGPSPGLSDIEELARHPFVLHRSRARTQKIRLERRAPAVRGSGERAEPLESVELTVSGRVNVDDYAAMVEFVAAGHGIGLMPEAHLADGVAQGRLVPLAPEWGLPTASLHIVFSSRRQPARVRLLIDFLCGNGPEPLSPD
jgi:DNA-binding transcriptional LysR family regulator